MAPILQLEGLTRRFGGVTAVDALVLTAEGELVSIIGPNGAGKTTVFNLVTGLDAPDAGTRHIRGPRHHRLAGRTACAARLRAHVPAWPRVRKSERARQRAGRRAHAPCAVRPQWPVIGRSPSLRSRCCASRGAGRGSSTARGRNGNPRAVRRAARTPRIDNPAFSLSYANRRRLEIARALSLKPRVLFLDEPTAGMNPTETSEMLEIIRRLKGRFTILLIEHKLDLVMQLSDRVVVMDDGARSPKGCRRRSPPIPP
jgi:branched-chain amino acid transport system ATP-binding protein